MKKCLINVLAALFLCSSIFAQVSTDPNAEFYDMVERWEIMGIIQEQPPLRPYPLNLIESILTEVINGSNEKEAQNALELYEQTFKKPFHVIVGADANLKIDDNAKLAEKQGIGTISVGGDVALPKYATIGYNLGLVATNERGLGALPQYSAQPYMFKDSGFELSDIEVFLNCDANIAVGNKELYAQLGVYNSSFGPFYKENAVISPNAKHTANFAFVYNWKKITYTQAFFGLSAANYDYEKSQIGDLFSEKFLSLHSINVNLLPWLSFAFYETVIYGGRFEPAYLIPVVPYMVTQGLTGFDDNTFMALSFTIRPIPDFAWVTDIYVDDAQPGKLIKLDFDSKLRGTFQSAFKYTPSKVDWFDKVQLSYTLVTPYMYTHKQNYVNSETGDWKMKALNGINYQEYTTAGEPLGLPLPPNTEKVALTLSFSPVKRLKITANGSYTRHANVNESITVDEAISYLNSPKGYLITDGGIHNHSHYLKDGNPDYDGDTYLETAKNHFLFMDQETKMHTFNLGFDVDYKIVTSKFGSLTLCAGYTFEHIINAGVDNNMFPSTDATITAGWNTQEAKEQAVKGAISEWRSKLTDKTNHYIRFGLKYVW